MPIAFPAFSCRYSAMSLGGELRIYLWTFKCFGLLCFTHEARSGYRSHASRTDDIMALVGLLCSQFVALASLCHVTIQPGEYGLPMYGQVGNTYFVCNHGLSCLTVSLIHLYFYVRRGRLITLISLLLHHSRIDLEHGQATEFVRIYALVASQVLLTGVVQGMAYLHSDFEWWKTALLTAIAIYSYMLFGLVVALHYCLVRITASSLRTYNEDLAAAVHSDWALSNTPCSLRLRQRSRLLWVCLQRLNSDFGLVLVLIVAFLLFAAPAAPFFLITIVFKIDASKDGMENLWYALIVTLLWNLPIMVLIVMTLRTDEVGKEVSPLPTAPTRNVIT